MKVLRNISLAVLCACIFAPATLAEEALPQVKWAKGTVRAAETVYLYAPVGGQLTGFDLEVGDDVQSGASLMSVRPLYVTAPYDGVIRIGHAKVGDIAQSVINQYGALCYLERPGIQWLSTSTSTAYDDADNRDIRPGESVRVYNNKSGSKDKKEALGRVVSVNGSDFVVEFHAGLFDEEETVSVYRGTGDEYKDKDRVGKGKARRVPLIAIAGDGVIADVLVADGQSVTRGQSLYVLDSGDAIHETPPELHVTAEQKMAITSLHVQPGQYVIQGQLLVAAAPLENLECTVDVDELDILSLSPGQTMLVKLDADPENMLSATVERIAPLGKEVLDTTKYAVTLKFTTATDHLLPGMHVTAYWD